MKTEKFYTIKLTDIDRIHVRQVRDGRIILEFSVQYEALILSRWRKITRFDNAHGTAHRHVYYPSKREYRYIMSTQDCNQAFTESQFVIKKNFMKLREAYILLLSKNRGNINE